MVYRVVSTKLTEEEHDRLLEICNRDGCTPSAIIKEAVISRIEAEEDAIRDGTHDSCINQNKTKSNQEREEQEKKPKTLEEMLRAMKRENS